MVNLFLGNQYKRSYAFPTVLLEFYWLLNTCYVFTSVLWPRPQQRYSHPSLPVLSALHRRPEGPTMPACVRFQCWIMFECWVLADLRVVRAVVRAGLDVDQRSLAHRELHSVVPRPSRTSQSSPEPTAWLPGLNPWNLHGWLVVLLLQVVSDVRKPREAPPASLEFATAGDPVTAAFHQHQPRQRLNEVL